MKKCFELSQFGYKDKGLVLEQYANGLFRVSYGLQVTDDLTYNEAAQEFGYCLFHALACDGQLDNGVE